MSETALIRSYAGRRDAEAFAQLVVQYERMVFAACRRKLHDPADVDDAVQETFLRLAQNAGDLRSNLGGWLHRCAVNVSADLNRRRASRGRREAAVARPAVDRSQEAQQMLADLREHLDAAMERLDPEARELIVQRYLVGKPQVEIAAGAGVAPSTIAHRLNVAVEKLRGQLKTLGSPHTLVAGAAALILALQAESASACVPVGLTANIMKIGLAGVGPKSAAAGIIAGSRLAKTLAGLGLAAAIVAGLWWVVEKGFAKASAVGPEKRLTADAPPTPAQVADYRASGGLATLPDAGPPFTVEIRLWTAEGNPVTTMTPQLLDLAGNSIPPAPGKQGAHMFTVHAGNYRVLVKPIIGEPEMRAVAIADTRGKNGERTPVDILLH